MGPTVSNIDGSYFITTAIPYVNAAPHLGHALEFVQTDVLARHRRLRGQPVRFLSGTDDHALKNVTAAARAGVPVADFVASGADSFECLRRVLNLSTDDFIRTSSDPRHRPGVELLWRQCAAQSDFYRKRYEGLYCVGCEQFYRVAELDAGRCHEHGTLAERVVEENWFFRLSKYADAVERAIVSGRVRVNPVEKANEVLSVIRSGLDDISVSRPAARADGWGIAVPDDPSQVIYVWWDALTNYVTALDYATPASGHYQRWWVEAAERVHVIGKGISRFHAVYWIALLLSAGQPLPNTIHVHDYVNLGGTKLAKSAGNALAPHDVVDRYGTDALRWWFTREVPLLGDTEYSVERLVNAYNGDLANGLGNLVSRTLTLVTRHLDGLIDASDAGTVESAGWSSQRLDTSVADLPGRVDRALADADFRAATGAIVETVDEANRFLNATTPWALAKAEHAAARDQLTRVLSRVVQACRAVTREIAPFIPDGAEVLARQLGTGGHVASPKVTFPRIVQD
jgi:methionyl-tRNA synthetase